MECMYITRACNFKHGAKEFIIHVPVCTCIWADVCSAMYM